LGVGWRRRSCWTRARVVGGSQDGRDERVREGRLTIVHSKEMGESGWTFRRKKEGREVRSWLKATLFILEGLPTASTQLIE
jgi:hypothetical protein